MPRLASLSALALAALLGAAGARLAGLVGLPPAAPPGPAGGPAAVPAAPLPRAEAEDLAALRRDATVRAVERLAPAVVNISTERVVVVRERLFGGSDLFEEFFRDMAPRRRVRTTSLGSGVVIDPDGYVVTNAHVVARASTIQVTLAPPRGGGEHVTRDALLINLSPDNDLALLKIESGGPFPAAKLGRSEDALIGETVIALGNPFGLESSVTRGVLSAAGRALEEGDRARFRDFLQTDAAINPGNSGGPLANLAGEVIGINTAIHAQAHGIGFAIPAARVQSVLAELLDERELSGTWAGLALAGGAAMVQAVEAGSPAERAGLRAGDRIAEVGGERALSAFDVRRRIVERKAGEKLRLAIVRGEEKAFEVELEVAKAPVLPGERIARERLGLRVKPVTPLAAERAQLEAAVGVQIIGADVGSPAERAGLQAGDVLLRMGRPLPSAPGTVRWGLYEMRTLEDLSQVLAQTGAGDRLLLQVLRDGREARCELEAR